MTTINRIPLAALLAAAAFQAAAAPDKRAASASEATEGTLYRADRQGRPFDAMPLKRTDVNAEVSGFLARVSVVQEFANDSKEPVEAVYKFPLPHDAAVDSVEMIIGKRVIKADIKRREDARKAYEDARDGGRRAALLDQERPNVFTQRVANIMPGDSVKIHIQYVEALKYEDGDYEFVFPMVVGPRYAPAHLADPDAVTPRRTPEGTRAGHDINIKVSVDAGMSIGAVASPSHNVDVLKAGGDKMMVALKNARSIPNRDFILRYDVAGERIKDAVLVHKAGRGGFFTLILQPPDRVAEAEVTPKEIVFVVDTSGSMRGYPLEKIKEVINLAFDGLHPRDTFNLITFSGDEHILFPKPVAATHENLLAARRFLQSREGRGGTEMMKAVRAALDPSDQQGHLRVVCFMTDGEVGNDMEILAEIQKHRNARVFAFGIGNSVNRFLLDGMSRQGRGETQFVTLGEDGSIAARKFHERVRTPLLTDIEIDWNGLEVSGVSPSKIPDLFSAKPLVVSGRYDRAGKRTIQLRGRIAGRAVTREIEVELRASEPRHDVLATLWARRRIEELSAARPGEDVKRQITELGLEFRLMTAFTSFVAVEEKIVNESGQPRRVEVPVEMPDGVSYEGVGGPEQREMAAVRTSVGGFMPGGGMPTRRGAAMPALTSSQPVRAADSEAAKDKAADSSGKIHASLLAASAGTPVAVRVWLNEAGPAVIARLRAAGLVIERIEGNLVVGRVDAAKLEILARIAEVRMIAPTAKTH